MKPGCFYNYSALVVSLDVLLICSRVHAFTCTTTPRRDSRRTSHQIQQRANGRVGLVLVPQVQQQQPLIQIQPHHQAALSMVADSGDDNSSSSSPEGGSGSSSSAKRKQRKKRKQVETSNIGDEIPVATVVATTAASSKEEEKPATIIKSNDPVNLQVMDVRDIVAGRSPSSTTTPMMEAPTTTSSSFSSSSSFSKTPYAPNRNPEKLTAGRRSGLSDDALERMLEDARNMQIEDSTSSDSNSEGGFSIPKTAQSALSTLVTIDFFVVCGLLLWFLAGIFASYALKDDTIQIAFNNIFTPVVQPALGVLMIGSVASAFFKEEGGEEN